MIHLDRLVDLQAIDIRIEENARSRREAEASLADESSLDASHAALDNSDRHANEIRARLRSLELEANGIGDQIKTVEARLYDGRTINPKELSGLEQDAEMLKRRKNEVEDRMLDAMGELETAETTHGTNRSVFDRVSAERSAVTAHARAELAELEEAAFRLRRAREQLCAQIAPTDLTIYENLRREKKGRALAHIKGSSCEACGFSLPSGLASRARFSKELEFCNNCGRILIS
jgi:predicted  nucleic acid-binding Zn-ribbon protein